MKKPAITTCFRYARQTNVSDLIQTLDHCATIVTGNRRLARSLLQVFNREKLAEGYTAWPVPDILPWDAWLQRLWQEVIVCSQSTVTQQLLLTPEQEYFIWQKILAEQTSDAPLHATHETAVRLMEAWQILHAWAIPYKTADFDCNADTRLFRQLTVTFEANCRKNGWLSTAVLPEKLTERVRAGDLRLAYELPRELVLTGFEEWTPRQLSLLDALEQAGCALQWVQLSGQVGQIGKLACADSRDEVRQAAHWIRQRMQADPAASIALVVPELAAQREMICQTLDEVLIPQTLQPGQHDLARPYNLSLGKPLSRYPLISLALDILDLTASVVELPLVNRVLRSSCIAGGDREMNARALLDARLRESGEWNLDLQKLLANAARGGKPYSCPLLAVSLSSFIKQVGAARTPTSLGEWARRFEQWLKVFGWPGERSLSSEEYQVAQAWREVLKEFSTLDWVVINGESVDLSTALEQFRRMVSGMIFQPESAQTAVQVLGLFETSGLQFDYLWIMGLHDGVFPATPRPNPFLPLALQRRVDAPHASAQRELRMATTLLQRITTSAGEVVISYPQRDGDAFLEASPLIDVFPELNGKLPAAAAQPSWRECVYHSRQLTPLSGDVAPAFTGATAPGGSRLFKLQAACPFLAFAELRLGARPLGHIQIGLDARVRGILLHRIMEMIWAELDSSEMLKSMADDVLDTLVTDKVSQAVGEIAPRYPHAFGQRLQILESRRLHALVLAWLELEKQRSPFRVSGREQEAELNLDDLHISLRLDRMDTLETGEKLLIDYKTGEAKTGAWFGDRPDEPQLPLYSLLFPNDLIGIAFAQIRAGDVAFKGVAGEEVAIHGVKSFEKLRYAQEMESWGEVCSSWRETMKKLVRDFMDGEARVNPKHYPQTCTYCALKPLCRIGESLQSVLAEDQPDETNQ